MITLPSSPHTRRSGTPSPSAGAQSAYAACPVVMARRAVHTAELTLKPDPNAICHTRSPRATPSSDSIQANTYQMDADDVLPNRRSASLEGRARAGVRPSWVSTSSMTARPPVCRQKWSKASLKSGM